MTDIKVVAFYKKGAHVIVSGSSGTSSTTFAARKAAVSIAHNPHPRAKKVKDPAWEIVSYRGKRYLALNPGHSYKVSLKSPSGEDNVFAAEGSSAPIEINAGWQVSSVDSEGE